jgi:hypothetical protein
MRIAVEYQAYTLEDALKWARIEQERSRTAPAWRAWMWGSQRWIERRGQPATRKGGTDGERS